VRVTATSIPDAAQAYLSAGLCVLSAIRAEKRPAVGRWKQYQKRLPTPAELSAWLANKPDAVCILCGAASQDTEILDFDAGGELFSAWWDHIPPDLRQRLVIERTPSGGWHVIYRCACVVCGNLKLAQRKAGGKITTLIETRGEGGLFLCAPTAGYEVIQGDLCDLPVLTEAERDILLQAAWELNEYVPPAVDGPALAGPVGPTLAPVATSAAQGGVGPTDRPGDDFNARGDVRAVLEQHGWVRVRAGENEYWRRPGKASGWSATLKDGVLYVFSSNAAPFEHNQAYSPFAVRALLDHGGDFEQAARSLRELGFGGDSLADSATGADISAIMQMSAENSACPADNADIESDALDIADPGPIPEHLFHVPGLVAQVMDFTLAKAPYPNVGLAFCGALALQSYLCGRKVRTVDDLRPNLYLLALAGSGSGKDFPRKVNTRVMFEIGHIHALGDKFASGQGIQDALLRSPAMLFQNDEMDGVLRQINSDREAKMESITNVMMTIYTSAGDIYAVRVKAGQKEASHIDQPHLTLLGTATPQYFYESLTRRMLTNGFFARLIIVDIGKRGPGQSPGSVRELPASIIETARWWGEFQPGTASRNLLTVHPDPRIVPYSPQAEEAARRLQHMADQEYDKAESAGDEMSKTAWSRTCENAKKLALIRACSESHEDPIISLPAVEWATEFAMHQTRRQLFMAATYVAENPFHADCLKLLRKLKEAPNRRMQRQHLLRAMRCKAADFDQLAATLIQQGEIVPVDVATKTKTAQGYQLA